MEEADLWDETVWQRDVDDTGDEARAAEEEEVPMETTGLFEWEIPRLSRDTALIL